MRQYVSHKLVNGAKVVEAKRTPETTEPKDIGKLILTDEFGHVHELPPSFLHHAKDGKVENFVGGYLVQYEPMAGETRGYMSWTPAEPFLKGYTLSPKSLSEPDACYWVGRIVIHPSAGHCMEIKRYGERMIAVEVPIRKGQSQLGTASGTVGMLDVTAAKTDSAWSPFPDVNDEDVTAVEDAVGGGAGAWDCVCPKAIIRAAWRRFLETMLRPIPAERVPAEPIPAEPAVSKDEVARGYWERQLAAATSPSPPAATVYVVRHADHAAVWTHEPAIDCGEFLSTHPENRVFALSHYLLERLGILPDEESPSYVRVDISAPVSAEGGGTVSTWRSVRKSLAHGSVRKPVAIRTANSGSLSLMGRLDTTKTARENGFPDEFWLAAGYNTLLLACSAPPIHHWRRRGAMDPTCDLHWDIAPGDTDHTRFARWEAAILKLPIPKDGACFRLSWKGDHYEVAEYISPDL